MIKCIIFDWGGVFSENDYKRISKAFNLPIKIIQDIEYKHSTTKDCSGFWKELREKYGVNKTDKQMADIFNYEVNHGFLKYLPKFKDFYVVLLSDQVTTHTNYLRKKYKKYLDTFDKVYFSNEVGMVKPHKKTFQSALNKIKFKADECLFLDDTLTNIKGAQSVGIHTIQFKNIPQVRRDFKKFSINI
jgi:glucose-1-phosphatase